MYKSIFLLLFFSLTSHADLSGGGLTDYYGNGVTSNLWPGTRNALDVETIVSGTVIDPRTRGWTLLNTTDSVNAVQSGIWTTGRTWVLSSATDSATVLQGTPATATNAWPVKITDGTNIATVKAASVSPLATDTAIVIGISPNGNQATAAIQNTQVTQLTAIFSNQTNGTQKVSTNITSTGTPTQTSVSCGTGSTNLLAAGAATLFVILRNPTTATQTIWVNVTGVAAVAAVPSMDLPPGGELDFTSSENSYLPTAQFNCISGGTASSLALIYK